MPQNAGFEGSIVVQNVRDAKGSNVGFNAQNETYENLVTAGVIDPTKVVRTALQNAGSIASLLLTTEALVAEIPEQKGAAGGGPPDMGGMGGMGMGRDVIGVRNQKAAFGRPIEREGPSGVHARRALSVYGWVEGRVCDECAVDSKLT